MFDFETNPSQNELPCYSILRALIDLILDLKTLRYIFDLDFESNFGHAVAASNGYKG